MMRSLLAALVLVEPAHSSYNYGGGFSYGGGGGGYGADCTSCSAACQAHNAKEAAKSTPGPTCTEYSYTDEGWGGYPAWCDPACNNVACARQNSNCNLEEAVNICKEADKKVKRLAKAIRRNTNKDGTVNATMSLRFGQVKLETTSPPDPTYMTLPVEYRLSWSDYRWSMNESNVPINSTLIECRDVAPSLLKIPSQMPWSDDPTVGIGTQQSLENLYFLPRLKATNRKTEAEYPLTMRTLSFDDATAMMTTRAKFTPVFSQVDYETDTPYFAFPFDVHTLYARLEAKPALALEGCSGEWLASRDSEGSGTVDADGKVDLTKLGTLGADEMAKILPASGDWVFDSSESEGAQVKAFYEVDASGNENKAVCLLRIRLRRNPMVYTLKAFLPDMIVMCIGMASLFINPAIPPLFGGRCSILIIAMLITMNGSLNRNNGLGRLSYLLKIDFVALLNLGMLLLAMGCSIAVHLCFRFEKLALGALLDRAVRFSLPSLIFPGVQIFEYMFLANDDPTGPVVFLFVWLVIAFTGVGIHFTKKHLAYERELKKMARRLENLSLDDPKTPEILQEAFVLFDADNSGALDAKEGRKLLRMVNPSLGRRAVADAIRSADANGQGIVEDDFQEMITNWALVDKVAEVEAPKPVTEVSVDVVKDYNA